MFGVTIAALLVGINLASAVNVGGFEIDANESPQARALYAGNNTPPGDDWTQTDPAPATGKGVFVPSTSAPHTAATDCYGSNIDKNPAMEPSTLICDGNSDHAFDASEPEQNVVSPSGKTPDDIWPIKPGNVRPKNDFSHAYTQASTVDSPCDPDPDANNTILHLAGHVGDNEGSHFWGFEFNEVAPTGFNLLKANGGATFQLNFNRSIGDLLVSFSVPGNANDPVALEIFQVSGFQADGDAIFTPATPIAACPPSAPRGHTLLATNNANDIEAPPWNIPVCDPTADNGSNQCRAANGLTDAEDLIAPRDFAEASIDLTAFGINPCFTNVIFTSRSAQVLEGADIQDVGGGDFPLCGKKSGVKFEDENADGDRDAGEAGLPGWTIKIYNDDGDGILESTEAATPVATLLTGADGSYQSDALPNGDYIACEVLQASWHQSLPNSGTTGLADCTSQSGDSTLGANGYAFTMSGPDHPGNDFGNFKNATVSGMKFKDADAGGDKDPAEIGLGGWQIHVFGTSGQGAAIHEHATTAANGTYSVVVPPGSYTVCETTSDHSGWVQSFPTSGTNCSTHSGASGVGYSVPTTSGDTFGGKDFGNTPLSKATITFQPQALLPDGLTAATRATSISCVDAANNSVGSVTNSNTLTTNNVKTNQSSLTCTITFIDP